MSLHHVGRGVSSSPAATLTLQLGLAGSQLLNVSETDECHLKNIKKFTEKLLRSSRCEKVLGRATEGSKVVRELKAISIERLHATFPYLYNIISYIIITSHSHI